MPRQPSSSRSFGEIYREQLSHNRNSRWLRMGFAYRVWTAVLACCALGIMAMTRGGVGVIVGCVLLLLAGAGGWLVVTRRW